MFLKKQSGEEVISSVRRSLRWRRGGTGSLHLYPSRLSSRISSHCSMTGLISSRISSVIRERSFTGNGKYSNSADDVMETAVSISASEQL